MARYSFFFVAIFTAFAPMSALAYEPTGVAVDGRVFHTSEGKPGPWHADLLKHEWGDYPFEARSRRWEGTGWFRLQVRPDGSVADAKVMRSTGHSLLDQSAIAAFHRWTFKPGKWKLVDEPMFFAMQRPR